jgi:hypothetical protein
MTNLTLVTNNPNPHHSHRSLPPLRLVHSSKTRLPKWSEMDDIWLKDLAEGLKEGLARRKGSGRPAPALLPTPSSTSVE